MHLKINDMQLMQTQEKNAEPLKRSLSKAFKKHNALTTTYRKTYEQEIMYFKVFSLLRLVVQLWMSHLWCDLGINWTWSSFRMILSDRCYFIRWRCVTLEFTTRCTFLWYEPKITTNFKAYCSAAQSQISFLHKLKYSEHFCAVSIPIFGYCRDSTAPSPSLQVPFLSSVTRTAEEGLVLLWIQSYGGVLGEGLCDTEAQLRSTAEGLCFSCPNL